MMTGLCAPQGPVSAGVNSLVCFLIRSQVQTCYLAENDLKLTLFQSLPPESRDSRCEPLHLAYVVLGMELGPHEC